MPAFVTTALPYVFLIVGFVLLVKGADFFVEGASSIASKLKVPSLIIGLTVVSMGTSAPEAAVSITSSVQAITQSNPMLNSIALGNIVGSNIFNFLMVVGISSVILPILTDKEILMRDMPINLGVTAVLLVMLLDGKLGRFESIILLVLFAAYIFMLIRSAMKNRTEAEELKVHGWAKSIIFLVVGLAGVIGGGQLVVNGAKTIAAQLGMSETLIGLTVVAIGTSLPELVTSVVAAKKGNSGIAMGNVVGSNIFNILFILGMAGSIAPISLAAVAAKEFIIDTIFLIGICVVMWFFAFSKKKTGRIEGAACIAIYVAYTTYIILRAYGLLPF